MVSPDRAILAIDLGEDKQVAALLDHDERVLGRRVVVARAHRLDGLLTWAGRQAAEQGALGWWSGASRPGHRWLGGRRSGHGDVGQFSEHHHLPVPGQRRRLGDEHWVRHR